MDRLLLAAVVIVTLLSSNPVLSQRRPGEDRGHPPAQNMCQAPGKVPGATTDTNMIPSRAIGLILTERCQEWKRLRRPLPPFCLNTAATGAVARAPDSNLCDTYRQYWWMVSDEDRRRDHDSVRRKHGSWD